MTVKKNIRKKKRKLISVRKKLNPLGICFCCGEKLDNTTHHLYCLRCYPIAKLRELAGQDKIGWIDVR